MTPAELAVVMPTYRRTALALRMFDALEQQTMAHDRFEVLLVDDCSADGTVEALQARAASSPLRVRVLSTPRNGGGPAGARNLGWRATSAPVIAFVDDDCVPAPQWLEAGVAALEADELVGVAQGRTLRPEGAQLGDWTIWREVLAPSPYFEGCNLFFRRGALEVSGGFAEDIGWYGEDTAAGWSAVEAGWLRVYVEDAIVYHDVVERGVRWRARFGYRERRNLMTVAARFPSFRREAFWRPWAFQRDDAVCTLAVAGCLLALRWRPALVLTLPYLRWRRPPPGHARPVVFMAERVLVDVAQAAGVAVGAARNGILVV